MNAFGLEASPHDIGFVNRYLISTDESNFEIVFTANFLISSHTFSANDKTLKFNVETVNTLNIRNNSRRKMKIVGILLSLLVILAILPSLDLTFAAPTIIIETSQSVYQYGDFLSIIIKVSEITGDNAVIYIIDSSEKKVVLLNRIIIEKTTMFPSQQPFDSAIWKPGEFVLELEYSDEISLTQFSIEDTGKIVLPFWIRDVAKLWVTDQIAGKEFSVAIEYMIDVGIIKIPYSEEAANITRVIPDWVKNNARWWATGQIDDTEFTLALDYLVKKGIITVDLSRV